MRIFNDHGMMIVATSIDHNGRNASEVVVINTMASFAGGYLIITDPNSATEAYKILNK